MCLVFKTLPSAVIGKKQLKEIKLLGRTIHGSKHSTNMSNQYNEPIYSDITLNLNIAKLAQRKSKAYRMQLVSFQS